MSRAVVKNGGKTTIVEPKVTIDCGNNFEPVKFLGRKWRIVEEDERIRIVSEINLSNVRFETCLKKDESWITGEEKLRRLKETGYIRLDAKIFQVLWENQHLIPESWKEKVNGNIQFISFDGTILQNHSGDRYVLCLCWIGDQMSWVCRCLRGNWGDTNLSACLESI